MHLECITFLQGNVGIWGGRYSPPYPAFMMQVSTYIFEVTCPVRGSSCYSDSVVVEACCGLLYMFQPSVGISAFKNYISILRKSLKTRKLLTVLHLGTI